MIDEMRLGFSGHCPTTVLADFYAAAFDLWHAGKRPGVRHVRPDPGVQHHHWRVGAT